ncbi:hypothetical protein [Actinacidiphila acidipaludis]|uniref:Transposase n=1 Tax=Actinacidiphila acidipaludis TaxID=2873382 RepID=A0ABS7QB84_9ACTN|nr:hypothetical protein [Streptomyces acidipaludis]MBY8879044.1 hypothetical protein [Streptomyces acidipaludis]
MMERRRTHRRKPQRSSTRGTAGEVFLVGMDRQGVVRISRAVDARTLGFYLHEIADDLIAGSGTRRLP